MTTVRERKRSIVESFRTGSRRRIEETPGIELLMGEGRLAGPPSSRLPRAASRGPQWRDLGVIPTAVEGSRQLTADRVFMNVGQRPRVPELPGLKDVPGLNSTTIMELDRVPRHLLVLGGGYVGVEFAQMFRRFGSAVSIVQRSGQVLTHEDADVAAEVISILKEDGIEVLLNSQALEVKEDAEGRIQLRVRTAEGERVLSGSHLLVAVGRVPNTDRLNLAAAGIETDPRRTIQVDDRLETSVPGVYALGDVTGGPAFTHISYDDYRIVRANLLDGGDATTTDRLVPYVVFIDPQLGRIGLTERQARKQDLKVRVARMPMSSVARALELDETRGLLKVIVDADTPPSSRPQWRDLAVEGGEVMTILQMAMLGDLPYTVLRDAVFAHPTLAESMNNLFATLDM